jgi:hypothetical protein
MDVPVTHRVCHILGLGSTPQDGHLRVSRGESFDLMLGSEEAHAAMLELCVEIERELTRDGRRMEDLTRQEFTALLRRIRRKGTR